MVFVEDLHVALESKRPGERLMALGEIAKYGDASVASGLDARVLAMLRDPDARVRERALHTLGAMGPEASHHAPSVAGLLHSDQKSLQRTAIQALGGMGASQWTFEVEAFLDSPDPDLAVAACASLGQLGAATSASKLVAKLSSENVGVAAAACASLAVLDAEVSAVAELLSSKEPVLRAAVLEALAVMSGGAAAHCAAAVPMVADASWRVRAAAADLICAAGSAGAAEVVQLGKMLNDPSPGVVVAAARAIGGVGPGAASQTQGLEAVLENNAEDRSSFASAATGMSRREPAARRKPACAAAAALAAIGIAGAKSAPKVAACLASQDAELRAEAARALGLMGAAGAKYEGDLVRLLGDASPSVAAAACCALGCLEARAQVGSLAPLLKSQFPAVRAAACQALGTMGPAAELHVEEVVRLLQDKSEQVASEAAAALPKCGEAAQVYASELCRLMLGDAPPAVRAAAALSLAAMGERGAAFQEEIEVLLQEDPAPEVQAAAESALRMIESHSTEVASAAARAAEIADAAASAAADAARAEAAAQAARAQLPLELAYVDPAAVRRPVALMFPGQGSQHVKMLQDVQDLPTVKDILAKANSILGYDILAICMEGPEEKLGQTRFCQPAMYIGGLAAVEKLKTEKPDVVRSAQCVAGLSLGEYVALTVAGALDVETGLRLVKLRGEAMQEAAEASPQMMASIAGLPLAKVEEICKECGVDGEVCQVANHLFPNGFACAGSKTSVERLVEVCGQTEGIIQARALKTSGAFHTKLMMPAREKLLAALKDVEPKMQPLRCDVYMNVTGQRLPAGTPPSVIIPMLADQLCSTVRWCPAMEAMIQDGIKEFYECGPMKQLKAMMKRISAEAFGKTASVTV